MHKLLTRQPTLAFALLVLLAPCTVAHAGRPLQTEDAGVLEPGECELEAVAQRQREAGARARQTSLGLNCGVGLRSQLGAAAATGRDSGQTTRSASIGGKVLLWQDRGDTAASFALAWSVDGDRQGARWQHAGDGFKLVATQPWGPGAVHMNLGQNRDRAAGTRTLNWAIAYEHNGVTLAGLNWAPMVEAFGEEHADPWVNLALRVTLLPQRLFVDVSVGQQSATARPRLVTTGLKFVF